MKQIMQYLQKKVKAKKAVILPVNSLHEMLYRGEIGSLAFRMGYHLKKCEEIYSLAFFNSLLEGSVETEPPPEALELLSYARLIYEWVEEGENVTEKLNRNSFNIKVEEALIQTFKEYKSELKRRKLIVSKWGEPRQAGPADHNTEWKVYRDVMHAATQKKFLLINEEEADQFLNNGQLLYRGNVKERKDIPACREAAKESLEKSYFSTLRLNSLLLVISEAATNIIKHAEEGEVSLTRFEDNLHIIVKDKGPGFVLEDLPNTVLMAGYSTKKSLGQGFTLMMKIVDKVHLALTSDGSTLVLSLALNKEAERIHA